MNILMVSAENDALPGGKVGGIGDVVRDMPKALAAEGEQVNVVMPNYGILHEVDKAEFIQSVTVMFAGESQEVSFYKYTVENSDKNVTQWIAHHPLFSSCGVGSVYCDDPNNRPFATDATKFALFNAAVGQAIIAHVFGPIDVLHLHDWHTAVLSVLRSYDPQYEALKHIRTTYTIHNLALQGIRPLLGDESSLEAWFPHLNYDVNVINDPSYHHCFNPMRAAINLCDKVHAVSPNYTKEIVKPSNYEQGFFGGEGLENDLQRASNENRLFGILNGCEYDDSKRKALSLNHFFSFCENEVLKWAGNQAVLASAHLIASTRLGKLTSKKVAKRPFIMTSVGRITNQKVLLLQQQMADGQSALQHILNELGDKGIFLLLGSGDAGFEQFLTQTAGRNSNFIFLKGYSETLSEAIYNMGDLFMMPSSFEPCGISQMLSMRAGQPCIAHSVGGLTDTIKDHENGFLFDGDTQFNQATNMISCFKNTLSLCLKEPKKYKEISDNASKTRFLWSDSAKRYISDLYQ
ncbi:glycogen synthase [Pseudocolwellia agarivorans]|uniref:glycogen synthase n=1 Tax=Pseudocolwellia agarivorans TaxID=1911682 RepID=UPI0009843D7E|nr:glycogen/starch synthase [Pseudocolwellia agarivorans]